MTATPTVPSNAPSNPGSLFGGQGTGVVPPPPLKAAPTPVSSPFILREFQGFGGSTPVVTVPLSSAHLAFQIAVKAGNLDNVRAVHADVGKDIDVNFRDPNNGRSFLHWAAFYGHKAVADFLIELGANKDIEGLGGCTPLHLAAQEGRVEMVTLLLSTGANKDKVNTAGATALCLAARQGHLPVVQVGRTSKNPFNFISSYIYTAPYNQNYFTMFEQCLLDNGVAKNLTKLLSGDTPLHLATERGHLDVVTCLVDNGADKSPISRAFRYSHDSILEYFKALGLSVPIVSVRLTLPGQSSGMQKCIQPLPRLYEAETATDYITNNDVVDIFDETIGGFYKLVDGRGYSLVANRGCLWSPTQPTTLPPFSVDSLPSLQSDANQIRVQLHTLFSHRIRPDASLDHPEVGLINHGDIIEVYSAPVAGFYRLVDGRGYTLASGAGFSWTKL